MGCGTTIGRRSAKAGRGRAPFGKFSDADFAGNSGQCCFCFWRSYLAETAADCGM